MTQPKSRTLKPGKKATVTSRVLDRKVEKLADMQIIGTAELGAMLGRTARSIRLALGRNPESMPKPFGLPGSIAYRWRMDKVREWLEAHAEKSEVPARTPKRSRNWG